MEGTVVEETVFNGGQGQVEGGMSRLHLRAV